jgi:tRNA A37 threonylcarbamoyladenosine dehydratase
MTVITTPPTTSFNQAEEQRLYSALERLYGKAGAESIRTSHVMVIGIGGVGSWSAEALARSGVGKITLVDLDHLSLSNINRQIHAVQSTLGQSKVLAMRDRLLAINPSLNIDVIDDFVTPDNWLELVPVDVNAVIDACDQLSAKLAMSVWARNNKKIFITVGAAGGKKTAQAVEVADLSVVSQDPVLAKLRYQLRKHHGAPKGGANNDKKASPKIGINCVFSTEPMLRPTKACDVLDQDSASAVGANQGGGAALNCQGYGSQVVVTATFGLTAAGWVMQMLANTGNSAKNSPKTIKQVVN